MKSHDKSWAIILVVIFLGLLMWFLNKQNFGETQKAIEIVEEKEVTSSVVEDLGKDTEAALFVCDNQRQIGANFKDRGVLLNLSDERRISLLKKVSASGVKYSNMDDSFIFWTKAQGAYIEENSKVTFDNCREVQAEIE